MPCGRFSDVTRRKVRPPSSLTTEITEENQHALPFPWRQRDAGTRGCSVDCVWNSSCTNPWTVVTEGTFVTLPPDLKALREKRGFHAAFVLGAAAAIVSAAMKGLRVAAPPPSPAELIEDYLLSAAAEGA